MSGFGSNPTTGTQGALSVNQFPLSSVAEPGRANGDLTALEGGPGTVDSNSNRTAPASVYVKDGGDVAQGTTTDAAVTGDNAGTLSAKLRGLTKILADIWDSTNHLFHQNVKQVGGTAIDTNSGNKSAGTVRVVLATDQPALTNKLLVTPDSVALPANQSVDVSRMNGVATAMGNGVSGTGVQRVTIASDSTGQVALASGSNVIGSTTIQTTSGTALVADQSNTELRVSNYGKSSTAGDTAILVDSTGRVLIGRSTTAVYTLASTPTSGSTQNSGDLTVGPCTELSLDINTTAQAGTNPTIQYFYERKGADGIYYVLWQSNVLTIAANTISTSIGTGMAYNQSLGLTGRLRWVVGGSATPTYTHSLNIYAK